MATDRHYWMAPRTLVVRRDAAKEMPENFSRLKQRLEA
jgi:hypothetical protein